jgi:ribosomal protein S18 acetylase RimI-like enzyme
MTIASIDIVPIREDLIESFHAALDVVIRERVYLSFLEAPPIESTREFVRDNIAKGQPQLVALDGGRVVGWCDVTAMQRMSMRHCGVLGMALLPEWRGRGLGERLIRRSLEAARVYGFARVELTVRHDNARAQALYSKVGFEVEGRKRRAGLVDGVFHDIIVMALLYDGAGVRPSGSDTVASG